MDKDTTMSTIDKQKALRDAAREGRIEDVKKYLNDDAVDVNCKKNNRGTALHYACAYGHLEIVELLLKYGADIELRSWTGRTPLLLACKKGFLSIVKLLLDRGTNITVSDNHGHNPLHAACCTGEASIIKLLLDSGCAINDVDGDGDTPLHIACDDCHTDCVAELLTYGADTNIQCIVGDTPLHIACVKGSIECVTELLAHGADATVKNNDGDTPMDVALTTRQQSIIDLLLKSERDKYQRQHVTDYISDAKECIMAEMKVLKAEVAECVANVSAMDGRYTSSKIERTERMSLMLNVKEYITVAEMKAEVSAMEERLASRVEAMLNRQCDKWLMREETEMNKQSIKRPRIQSMFALILLVIVVQKMSV